MSFFAIAAPIAGKGLKLASKATGWLSKLIGEKADDKVFNAKGDATDSSTEFKTPGQRKQETTTLIAWIGGGLVLLGLLIWALVKRK